MQRYHFITKPVRLTLIVTIIIIATYCTSFASDSDVNISYLVTIHAPETGMIHVKVSLSNVRYETIDFRLQNDGECRASNVTAFDIENHPRTLEFLEKTNTWCWWRVHVNGANPIMVQYDIPAKMFLSSDFGLLWGAFDFLWPEVDDNSKISVEFDLPANWVAATHWDKEGQIFHPTYATLLGTRIGVGPFHEHIVQVGQYKLFVWILDGLIVPTDVILDDLAKLFDYFLSIYGPYHYDRVLVLAENGIPGGCAGTGFFFNPELRVTDFLQYENTAHEMSHLWIGQTIRIYDGHYSGGWFNEGFNRYYGYIGTLDSWIWGDSHFNEKMLYDFRVYLNEVYGTKYDVSLVDAARLYAETGDIMYYNLVSAAKGALVAYMLNEEIIHATNGKKNLNDVMRYLFDKYTPPDQPFTNYITNEDFVNAVNHVCPSDLSEFFDDYLNGTSRLPLDDVFDVDKCAAYLTPELQLHVPVIGYDTATGMGHLRCELQYEDRHDGNIWFKVTKAADQETSNFMNCQIPTYSVSLGKLHLPLISYESNFSRMSLWGDFEYVPTSDGLIWLKVTGYGQN